MAEGADGGADGDADATPTEHGTDGADGGSSSAPGTTSEERTTGRRTAEAESPRSAALSPAGPSARPLPPRRTGLLIDPRDLRAHVEELLRAFLGGYRVDAFGNFTFTHEGARIFVTVGATPFGPQVGVFSITNVRVPLTTELARFLLSTNHRLGFGAFSYDPETSAVWLRHSLLGTTLDGPELQAAVISVASTAADVDEMIRDRFGGQVFSEEPADAQDHAAPPAPEPPHPNASGYL